MSEVRNIPRLRFLDFEVDCINHYKKYNFSDLFVFSIGKNIKQSEASPEFNIPCVRYGELYHLYNEVIFKVVNRTNIDESELVFSEGNEILLPSAGEDPLDIGSASALTIPKIAIGRTINILKPKEKGVYNPIYVSYYINQQLKLKISKLAKGVSISNVYNSDLKKLNIKLPPLPEQQKIADFLIAVDKRIELLEKKKTLLETYKKGVMKKIFNQEIRFKDDNGNDFPDWEEKRLGDVTNKKSSNISANSIEQIEGDYIVYGATGELKKIDFYEMDRPYISIVKDGSGVGRVNLCKPFSSVLGTLDILTNNEFSDLDFIFQFLSKTSFLKYVTGSSIPHIYYKDYSKLKMLVPTVEEQFKITEFLSSIDNQIELLETQIDKSKTWKKGLLQKMFV